MSGVGLFLLRIRFAFESAGLAKQFALCTRACMQWEFWPSRFSSASRWC